MKPSQAVLLTPVARIAIGILKAISRASLLGILAALLFSDGPLNPLRLIRLVTVLSLLPALTALLGQRLLRARVQIAEGNLTVEQHWRKIEVPLASIVDVVPWVIPLPGPGFWIHLRAGGRWKYGIQSEQPAALNDAIAAAGVPSRFGFASRASLVYSAARSAYGTPTPFRRVLQFPLFALLPTIPLFRVHQIIAYGGAFGEYYLYGAKAYLAGFAIYWTTVTIYCLLYAAALRSAVEIAAIATALVAPRHAPTFRKGSEVLANVAYYLGVPIVVILRFVSG